MAKDSSAIGRLALLATFVLGAAGPVPAQETPEQREACMHDTKRLCENAMPDIGRAVECLKANRTRLNYRCRVALDKPPAPSPQTAPSSQTAPTTPSSPAPTAAAPKPQTAGNRPAPSSGTEAPPRRRPHLAFAPHWRYTLRKPQVPLARQPSTHRRVMTPAERVVAMQRAMARRCRAAGAAYNAYSGTCGTNYFGGFFQ